MWSDSKREKFNRKSVVLNFGKLIVVTGLSANMWEVGSSNENGRLGVGC